MTRVREAPSKRNSSSGGGGGGLQSGVGLVRLTGPWSLPRIRRAGSTEAYWEDIGGGREERKSDSRGALKVGR